MSIFCISCMYMHSHFKFADVTTRWASESQIVIVIKLEMNAVTQPVTARVTRSWSPAYAPPHWAWWA